LLSPLTTVAVAVVMAIIARLHGTPATLAQTLAVVVHASVVLVIGQLVATPLHYLRESLTSPLNLAAVLPLMQPGTWPARIFGTLDLSALWWAGLLAIGMAQLTGRQVRYYAWRIAALFLVFAIVTATAIGAMGGA
jgi:hypothetical protein